MKSSVWSAHTFDVHQSEVFHLSWLKTSIDDNCDHLLNWTKAAAPNAGQYIITQIMCWILIL